MARLGALRELDLDHPDLRRSRLFCEAFRIEPTVVCPAAEIAAADFPDEIAALAVVRTDAAFAGIVIEAAARGPAIEGADRIGRQGAEAHCRDVENRGGIGLTAIIAADRDAKTRRIRHGDGPGRMIDELVSIAIDID